MNADIKKRTGTDRRGYTVAVKFQDELSVSRRGVIGAASLVPLGALGVAAAPPKQTFSEAQFRIIEAFVDRLIPTDENGPGAGESGVAVYIDRSFGDALAGERPVFAAGLEATDAFARSRHGVGFAELDVARKDAVLAAIENNDAGGFSPDSRTFFYRVRQLTLEGMFGDPFYGGNRGFAGWDLIRYPGPRMAVSANEQRMRAPIKPLRTSARGGRHGH